MSLEQLGELLQQAMNKPELQAIYESGIIILITCRSIGFHCYDYYVQYRAYYNEEEYPWV